MCSLNWLLIPVFTEGPRAPGEVRSGSSSTSSSPKGSVPTTPCTSPQTGSSTPAISGNSNVKYFVVKPNTQKAVDVALSKSVYTTTPKCEAKLIKALQVSVYVDLFYIYCCMYACKNVCNFKVVNLAVHQGNMVFDTLYMFIFMKCLCWHRKGRRCTWFSPLWVAGSSRVTRGWLSRAARTRVRTCLVMVMEEQLKSIGLKSKHHVFTLTVEIYVWGDFT